MNNTKITLFNADLISPDLLGFTFLLSIFFGIYVIISNNPVLSVLFLIGLFFTVSIYLILLGLHFIGLSYLLIYVGAISMLFLFILMLINIRVSELFTDNRNSILLATLTILCFNFSVNDTLPQDFYTHNLFNSNIVTYIIDFTNNVSSFQLATNTYDYSAWVFKYLLTSSLINVAAKSWDSVLLTVTHISSMGNVLYTNLFILFILTSIILLLAMVGAIVITINKSTKFLSEPPLPRYASVRLESNPEFYSIVEQIVNDPYHLPQIFNPKADGLIEIRKVYYPRGQFTPERAAQALKLISERYNYHQADLISLNAKFKGELDTLAFMCKGYDVNISHIVDPNNKYNIAASYPTVQPAGSITQGMFSRVTAQVQICDTTFNTIRDSMESYQTNVSRSNDLLNAFGANNAPLRDHAFRPTVVEHNANVLKYLGLNPHEHGHPHQWTYINGQPLGIHDKERIPVFISMRHLLERY